MTTPRECDPLFDEFWAIMWPRTPQKQPKDPARKSYSRLVKSQEMHVRVMESLRRELPIQMAKQGEFRPMAATWLNQRRWEDETASVQRPRVIKCVECADTEQVIVGPPVLEIRRCSCHRYAGETLQKIHPDDWREYQQSVGAV